MSNDKIDIKVLQSAIDKWDDNSQIEMIKEECLELALALQKLNRINGDRIKKSLRML